MHQMSNPVTKEGLNYDYRVVFNPLLLIDSVELFVIDMTSVESNQKFNIL